MNFTNTDVLVPELEQLRKEYVSAAQDVRDPVAFFMMDDVVSNETSMTRVTRPPVRPTPIVERNKISDPVLPQEEARTNVANKISERKIEDLVSERSTTLNRFEKALTDNLAGYRQRRAASWVTAAKGDVSIQVTKKSSERASIELRPALEDGVVRIDAVGGVGVAAQPLPLGLDDIIDAATQHAQPNLGNLPGIAGGKGTELNQGALAAMSFIMLRPEDLGDLLKEDRQSAAQIGNVTYSDIIKIPDKSPIIQTSTMPIYRGYPMIEVGLFGGSGAPSTILDVAGDSTVVDNGDGTYDLEYDILFGTGESVARQRGDVLIEMKKHGDSASVYNVILENTINALRVKGESLVFLRVTRTITIANAFALLGSGYFQLVDGKTASQKRLDRLKQQGRKHQLPAARLERFERLADGGDISSDRLYRNGALSLAALQEDAERNRKKVLDNTKRGK